jgi:hypothetical protein
VCSPFNERKDLPRHLVGLVTLPQAEGAGEVAGQQIHLLDAGNQSLVDGLLVGSTAAVDLLLLEIETNLLANPTLFCLVFPLIS